MMGPLGSQNASILARTNMERGYREYALQSGERKHSLFRLALEADPVQEPF